MNKGLIEFVIDQMLEDINAGDFTAIEELLKVVPEDNLIAFLNEVTEENLEIDLDGGLSAINE